MTRKSTAARRAPRWSSRRRAGVPSNLAATPSSRPRPWTHLFSPAAAEGDDDALHNITALLGNHYSECLSIFKWERPQGPGSAGGWVLPRVPR